MAAGDVYRVSQQYIFFSQIVCFNTFHVEDVSGSVGSAGIASDWNTNIVPTFKANLSAMLGFTQLRVERIAPNGGDMTIINLSGQGSASAAFYWPSVACAIITWRTALTGRRGRGRTYLPGMACTNVNADLVTLTATTTTRVGNMATAIMNRYGPSGAATPRLGVFSRLNSGGTPPFSTAGFNRVVSYTVQPYIGSMGSRRYGRGM